MQTDSNLQKAKNVSLIWYLAKLGHEPAKTPRESPRRAYFKSPFRNENNASFVVDKMTNKYTDWGGDNSYGDVIDFVSEYDGCTTSEAIEKILGNEILHTYRKPQIDVTYTPLAIEVIKQHQHVEFKYLVDYLEERLIPLELANKYLVHVEYVFGRTPWTTHSGLGFANDKGGWEIRNRHWKGGTSPKSISTIQGNKEDTDKINLFEGFFDFLSALVYYDTLSFDNDTIVLNSLSFVPFVSDILMNIGTVNVFFDSDAAGDDKLDYLLSKEINAIDQRGVYNGFGDFNEFLINTQ